MLDNANKKLTKGAKAKADAEAKTTTETKTETQEEKNLLIADSQANSAFKQNTAQAIIPSNSDTKGILKPS